MSSTVSLKSDAFGKPLTGPFIKQVLFFKSVSNHNESLMRPICKLPRVSDVTFKLKKYAHRILNRV